MEIFADYLQSIDNPDNRARTQEILNWVSGEFPNLATRMGWNHPMFTDHGTYIIGFSIAKNHLAVGPEWVGIHRFSDEIEKSGYNHSKMLMRIPWDVPVDYSLIKKMIEFNIIDKTECKTFWRK